MLIVALSVIIICLMLFCLYKLIEAQVKAGRPSKDELEAEADAWRRSWEAYGPKSIKKDIE